MKGLAKREDERKDTNFVIHETPDPGLSLFHCQLLSWDRHSHALLLLQKTLLSLFIFSDTRVSIPESVESSINKNYGVPVCPLF